MLKLVMNAFGQRRSMWALIIGLLILSAVNWTIFSREKLLTEGRVVLLELAPVDPRSLMQGDYMALRFQVANEAFPNVNLNWRRGFLVEKNSDALADGHLLLNVDEHGVAHFQKIAQMDEKVQSNQVLMRYRIRNNQVKFGTNAYFFEEGQATTYAKAKYGAFRVAPNGDMILTALHGADYVQIQNAEESEHGQR
ncbi:GDYXXLXY domain-containing protein [Undibacterium sp. Ji22W]|uniref:GDYXXLXY domain-containing protein n=1 Tax=Undibacterium sp. Ji22W TaxID=3413038 RepID=UPI003BF2544C